MNLDIRSMKPGSQRLATGCSCRRRVAVLQQLCLLLPLACCSRLASSAAYAKPAMKAVGGAAHGRQDGVALASMPMRGAASSRGGLCRASSAGPGQAGSQRQPVSLQTTFIDFFPIARPQQRWWPFASATVPPPHCLLSLACR